MTHGCQSTPTLISQLKRQRSHLRFWQQRVRNDVSWSRDVDLERRGQFLLTSIHWQIVDLDERIRALEYGDLPEYVDVMAPLPEEEA